MFSAMELAAIDWNGDIMHGLGQQMTTSDLWHCILTFLKVIRGHWPFVTPCITELANLAVFGVSWDPETEHVASFSHRHVYSASLHHPKSIRAIDSVCPQAILATTVMPKYSFKGEWVTYPENFSLKIAISQIQVDNFKNYSKHMETNPAFGCCIVFYI